MEIESSKITSKGQTTIPVSIRNHLSLNTGDRILFEMEQNHVILRKATYMDMAYLQSIEQSFAREWMSHEDCEAFDDL